MLLFPTTDNHTNLITNHDNNNNHDAEFFDHARCVVACYFSLMFFMFLLVSAIIWLSIFEDVLDGLVLRFVLNRV